MDNHNIDPRPQLTLQQLTAIGLDRSSLSLHLPTGLDAQNQISLGDPGVKRMAPVIGDYTAFSPPDWTVPKDRIPRPDSSVKMVHAYHLLEHLSLDDMAWLLQDVHRVLEPGGILQYMVPLAGTELDLEELDHKQHFRENSFRHLLDNRYYNPRPELVGLYNWQPPVILGVAARNLVLLGRLVAVKHDTLQGQPLPIAD